MGILRAFGLFFGVLSRVIAVIWGVLWVWVLWAIWGGFDAFRVFGGLGLCCGFSGFGLGFVLTVGLRI